MRAEGITQRAEGITQRAEGITQRAEGITQRAEGITQRAEGTTQRAEGTTQRAEGTTQRAEGITQRAEGITQRAEGITQRAEGITQRSNKPSISVKSVGMMLENKPQDRYYLCLELNILCVDNQTLKQKLSSYHHYTFIRNWRLTSFAYHSDCIPIPTVTEEFGIYKLCIFGSNSR